MSDIVTYTLEADCDVLRCTTEDARPIDFFIDWPSWLRELEDEPTDEQLQVLTDEVVGAIVEKLRRMGANLVDVYEHQLRHIVYLSVAPGGAIAHPLRFEVEFTDQLPSDITKEATEAAAFARKHGWSLWASQASDFAPAVDRADDYVIVVLRGEHARAGREALNAVVDLTRKAVTGGDGFAA